MANPIDMTTGIVCAKTLFAQSSRATYGAGTNRFDSSANASAVYALVVSIQASLTANGIVS